MKDDLREYLTGAALIALAIDQYAASTSSSLGVLTRAMRELSVYGGGPQLSHGGGSSSGAHSAQEQSFSIMANNAVMLADAIIEELKRDPS